MRLYLCCNNTVRPYVLNAGFVYCFKNNAIFYMLKFKCSYLALLGSTMFGSKKHPAKVLNISRKLTQYSFYKVVLIKKSINTVLQLLNIPQFKAFYNNI